MKTKILNDKYDGIMVQLTHNGYQWQNVTCNTMENLKQLRQTIDEYILAEEVVDTCNSPHPSAEEPLEIPEFLRRCTGYGHEVFNNTVEYPGKLVVPKPPPSADIGQKESYVLGHYEIHTRPSKPPFKLTIRFDNKRMAEDWHRIQSFREGNNTDFYRLVFTSFSRVDR